MSIKMLDKEKHVNSESGYMCRYIRSDTEYFRPHYHNYYEMFLVLKGNVCHIINNTEQNLSEGQLLFIRDFDVHDHKSADGNYFEFINIAFSKENFEEMLKYLGKGFSADKLLESEFPPYVILPQRDKEKLFYSMLDLENYSSPDVARMKMRTLLLSVFVQYFFDYSQKKSEIPLWLELTYEKMKDPSNFVKGTKRLYEICPKSREYLCRSLKRYYNTSPCALVNEFRLGHCVNLLLTSNLSVTDICYECGFENISWFYKVFYKEYGLTPKQYRSKHAIK